ncbi:bromodomain-containing protein 4-like [Schistocerca gregaria]|uniref:bromodomain-containing protein 4-like n=1 Tax=Schistocerca gregaria TaxID=7010 RepID=UPI00211DB658|nr:bromodomain-containing protein 4-like [Schistocerca gregaria]
MRVLLLVVALAAFARAQVGEEFDEELEEERGKRQTFAPRGVTQIPKGVPLPQQLRFPPPQAFRQAAPVDEEDELSRNIVTPTPQPVYRRPPPPPPQDSQRDYSIQRPQPQSPNAVRRPGPPPPPGKGQPLDEEELEEEKPDRLSLLLPQSKFDCNNKKTGYYADEGLNCEVFHYCQDNARHSWICPEGFLFHQVHLICMPPSSENICKQSSQFHFVNDYLYRPINAEEVQNKPNVTLRYSDRYYPDNFYEEESLHQQPAPIRASAAPPPPPPAAAPVLRGRPQVPQFRPQSAPHQVFHSPEEVNIPLQQRRPSGPPPAPVRGGFGPQHDDEYEYDDLPFRQG